MSDEKKYALWLAKERAKFSQSQTANLTLKTWKQKADNLWQRVHDQRASVLDLTASENQSELDSKFGRELWYPLVAGLLLNRNQQYAAAHNWYKLLYDPETQSFANIFDDFTGDVTTEHAGAEWLDDPYDPIAIANRRQGVWLRYTILSMVRNLIDWADDDFARGLSDTFDDAQKRYELASKILGAEALENECEAVILDIRNVILKFPKNLATENYINPLMELQSPEALKQAAADIRKILSNSRSVKQKQAALKSAVDRAVKFDRKKFPSQSFALEWQSKQDQGKEFEDSIFFSFDPEGPLRPPPPGSKTPFDITTPDWPFEPPVLPPPLIVSLDFCVPLNPVLNSLRQQISTQLDKLNHCLDFLGEPQVSRVYDCSTYDTATGLINRPSRSFDQFNYSMAQPRYRYNFLVEKARQYVEVAQRLESLLLQALQNRDNEAFAQLKAEHAVETANATVELRRLGRIEAMHDVDLARLQVGRAESQLTFWGDRAGDNIDNVWESLSDLEQAGVGLSVTSALMQATALVPAALGTLAGAVGVGIGTGIATVGGLMTLTGVGAPVGVPLLLAGGAVGLVSFTASMLTGTSALLQGGASVSGTLSQTALTYGAFERRFEDWKNQFSLAEFDVDIANSQETLANDRAAIADQEMVIAQLGLSQAREELRFLQTKITNAAFYDWMVRVLSRDYRILMQIATGVARMAQRAIEFERQEAMQLIVGDYWNVATGVFSSPALTNNQRSLGLLGAERLLTDLTKLDAFKISTERRTEQKLKTISLARMAPTDLAAFRQSGTITFNTLMEWFDDDEQGHYLRLIKSVTVTILAIAPPIDGINATLFNTGESSVVVTTDGGQSFVKTRAIRSFGERISLSSPFNDSGLFVFNYDDPMLLPFEGLGVETQWTLELPRGNNRFNFDTIADVFITIKYTAKFSQVYKDLLQELRAVSDVYEDTAVLLRLQFNDLWYHFKNHRQDGSGTYPPFAFKFHLPRAAFAPNLPDPINVAHITLLVSGGLTASERDLFVNCLTISHLAGGSAGAHTVLHSGAVPRSGGNPGDASSAFGEPVFDTNSILLSTRGNSANGLPANPVIGTAMADEWTIEFNPTLYLQPNLIDKVSDLLFIVTVKGQRSPPSS